TKRIEYLALGSQSQRERRKREVDEIIEKAEMEVSSFQTLAAYKLFGAALYWAEGNKSNGCGIANSDPHLILFMTQWFRRIFGVSSAQMTAHLNIYPQQNEKELKYFWSNLTGIPLENFGKSFIKPLNKGYKKNTLYYGTCKVRIQKGTDLRIRIFGWVKGMLRELDPQVELAQRKWEKLREVPRPINLIAK
ncbi:MAG: hypothetical protein Q8P39_02285, partial [Candidatus Yanofskybacteria bacterium]|nr:hypothetical protein [Candidatus Yanofskybacteria bacterium]